MLQKNKAFNIVKWLITIAAYGFLIYKLAHIEYWSELKRSLLNINPLRALFLISVVLLMPLNWTLETKKWQVLTSKSSKLSFITSLRSVLAGLNTGYITPNRIGEFAGRIVFLPDKDRWSGVLLSVVNSLSQNIVMTLFGVAGGIFYFAQHYNSENLAVYFWIIGIGTLLCIILYFKLPALSRKFNFSRWSGKLREAIRALSLFNTAELLKILLISVLRYAVFFLQFFLMLHFFEIDVSLIHALTAIPAMYLLVTYTPSFAAAEPAIRGSIALLIFSVFSSNEIGIMLTGILIWLINFVAPMLAGSVVLMKTKSSEAGNSEPED